MAHDAKTRKKAQVLYEAGKSFSFIESKLGVSKRSMITWAEAEGWVKGKASPLLHQKELDGAIQAAERAGLTNEHFFRGVRELIEARDVIAVGALGSVSTYSMPEYAEIEDDGTGRQVADYLGKRCEVIPDRQARKDGLKLMLESFPGLKVATQIQINPLAEVLNRVRARHNA